MKLNLGVVLGGAAIVIAIGSGYVGYTENQALSEKLTTAEQKVVNLKRELDNVKPKDFAVEARAFMDANADYVFETAIKGQGVLQQKQNEKKLEVYKANKAEVFAADAPFVGNPDGDLVAVEFLDFNCGVCRNAETQVFADLKAKNPNLKIIKHVIGILGQPSVDAAKLAYNAHLQGKFEVAYNILIANRGTKEELTAMLINAGVDGALLAQNEVKADELFRKTMELSSRLGVNSTPTFFKGDNMEMGFNAANKDKLINFILN